jgi:hypothetical protein
MKTKLNFTYFNYKLNNVLTTSDIYLAIEKFYTEELINTNSKLKFYIFFMVKPAKSDWITISSLQIADKTRKEELNTIFNIF